MIRLLATGSSIRGLPVVTIDEGEDVAEVRDVIYDPQAGCVVGLTLNRRGFLSGRRHEVLPVAQIHAIGRDAVMVESRASLTSPDEAPADVAEPPSGRDVTGDTVLTELGTSLGTVRDIVVVLGGPGEVVGYEIEQRSGDVGYIPLPKQMAVSGTNLIVPEATKDFVEADLDGLGPAVDGLRSNLVAG
jgi:uncharacterized protein YrrD